MIDSAHLAVTTSAERIVHRWAAEKELPVYNKDLDRYVNVLPETLKEHGGKYEKIPDTELDHDGHVDQHGTRRRQPHLPRKPQKPHRPWIPRDPPPSPLHPPAPPKLPMLPKQPKIHLLKPPKVPKPPEPHRYERYKRFLKDADEAHVAQVARVVQRYIETIDDI